MKSLLDDLRELLSLRPNDGPQDAKQCLELARSFLRLETKWIEHLALPSDTHPCVDLAEQLGQAALPSHIEREFLDSHFAQSTAESRACRNYLRWRFLLDCNPEIIRRSRLEDPFVPLVQLFRAGAEFSTEGWFFDVQGCGGINVMALRQKA